MKLHKIKIQNFRSILTEELNLDHKCVGLIGLNESGKSNVLSAVRLLEETYSATAKDRSKISGGLPGITLTFKLSPEEINEIKEYSLDYLNEVIAATNEVKGELVNISEVHFSLKVNSKPDGTLEKIKATICNFDLKIKKEGDYASFPKDFQPPMTEFDIGGDKYEVESLWGFEKGLIESPELKQQLADLDTANVIRQFREEVEELLSTRIPRVVYWEYLPNYLLPAEMTYDEFVKNDDPYSNSAPLFNAMRLSNSLGIQTVDDLKHKISLWKQDSSERRKDAKIMTDSLNKHIRRIWADYDQEISIGFEESKITIHINDPESQQMNFYSMEARSQGFKTFISFILTTAAEAEGLNPQNILLLLDEPETHLHPSGARYMREELLKLAEKGNYIIYATHSIFMIDRNNLERHIIVQKDGELTHLTKVDSNNFIQEAVMYEAMGAKIDEFSIGLKNIVFEGKIDLILFDFFINKCLDRTTHKEIQDHRLWNGGGTKRISNFLADKILPLTSRWYLILDNDNPGRQLSKTVEEKHNNENHVITCHFYSDSIKDFEIEDILPKSYLQRAFEKTIADLNISATFRPDFLTDSRVYSAITGEFKQRANLKKEEVSLFEATFKTEYERLVLDDILNIDKELTKTAKLEKFKQHFDTYSNFATDFVKTFKPSETKE